MKLNKLVVICEMKGRGDFTKAMKEEGAGRHALPRLGVDLKGNDAKSIFLSCAEGMARLLPSDNRRRLEVEALSLFPTTEDAYQLLSGPWNFALPFDGAPQAETPTDSQKEKQGYCPKTPYRDTWYGRIYTDMLKPRVTDREDRIATTGEDLIELAERLLSMVRLEIRSRAWDIAEEQNSMEEALRLMDWFNTFSSYFMAEIGKMACRNTDNENQNEIKSLKRTMSEYEDTIKEKEAYISEMRAENEEKEKIERKKREKFDALPIWIKSLCGANGGTQLINYDINPKTDELVFSFHEGCKNFGPVGKRIVEDSKDGLTNFDLTLKGKELTRELGRLINLFNEENRDANMKTLKNNISRYAKSRKR